MAAKSLFLSFLFLFSILGLTSSSAPSIEQQCSEEITKVMACLDYSTGKAAKPSESCCSSTKDIRREDPVCLCFVIQQTYEGLPTLKQLGIKVEKLLQLPTDCNLVNSSASDCPRGEVEKLLLQMSKGLFFRKSGACKQFMLSALKEEDVLHI